MLLILDKAGWWRHGVFTLFDIASVSLPLRTQVAATFDLFMQPYSNFIFRWCSGTFWKSFERIVKRAMPASMTQTKTGENVVNRHTYKLDLYTTDIPMAQWKFSRFKSLHKIYLPQPTIEGMERLLNMD